MRDPTPPLPQRPVVTARTFGQNLEWLEGELRSLREQLGRLETGVLEAKVGVRNLTGILEEVARRTDAVEAELPTVHQLSEVASRVRQQAREVEDALEALAQRVEDAQRVREAERRQQNQDRGALEKRLEGLERQKESLEPRILGGQETAKQHGGRLDALAARVEQVQTAVAALSERLRLGDEQLRRSEGRLSSLQEETARALEELGSKLDHLRVELDHLRPEQRFEEAWQALAELRAAAEAFGSRLHKLESFDVVGRVMGLEEALHGSRKEVVERLLRFADTQEGQRRRQIEDLQREIRELRRYAARLKEEE